MSTAARRASFLETEQGMIAYAALREMAASSKYNTQDSYSADSVTYPRNTIPFVDKHLRYLSEHKNLNVEHYLANLRLMTRIK